MYIKVQVVPNSKKESIEKIGDNRYKICVKPRPERNEANFAVCRILDEYFKYPLGGVKIISGHHSSLKLLKIGK